VNYYPDAPYWLALLESAALKRRMAKTVIYRRCIEGRETLADLLGMNRSDVQTSLDLTADEASAVLEALRQAPAREAELADLARQGIGLITRADVTYPDLLAERLPEEWLPYYLYYAGDPAIVTQPGVAVLGGTSSDEAARTIARDLARTLAAEGHNLVGGYDRGVDRLALDTAREAGGNATMVLPLGMNSFRQVLAGMRRHLDEGRLLVLSPYAPDVTYTEALAGARRALLVALSEAVYMVSPDDDPGDWPALVELLRAGLQVGVWQGRPGSWVTAGAAPFDDVAAALQPLRAMYGNAEGVTGATSGDAEIIGDDILPEGDGQAMGEPIEFSDADSAVEILGRTGTVPDVLARRLAERLGRDEPPEEDEWGADGA
jgi:predicted Rossmann fold nucleotide-binding protein DprA/Smf involved in DNA uptake